MHMFSKERREERKRWKGIAEDYKKENATQRENLRKLGFTQRELDTMYPKMEQDDGTIKLIGLAIGFFWMALHNC